MRVNFVRSSRTRPPYIATYAKYKIIPATGKANPRQRAGTGYIFTTAEIPALREQLAAIDHPLQIKWRTKIDQETHEGNI
jgi:hypothetical protein